MDHPPIVMLRRNPFSRHGIPRRVCFGPARLNAGEARVDGERLGPADLYLVETGVERVEEHVSLVREHRAGDH